MARIEIKRTDVRPTKMATNPLQCIVDSKYKVISDGYVYEYIGIGWIRLDKATKDEYERIPILID